MKYAGLWNICYTTVRHYAGRLAQEGFDVDERRLTKMARKMALAGVKAGECDTNSLIDRLSQSLQDQIAAMRFKKEEASHINPDDGLLI